MAKSSRCTLSLLRCSLFTALLTFIGYLTYRIFVGPVPTLTTVTVVPGITWDILLVSIPRWWDILQVALLTAFLVYLLHTGMGELNSREDWAMFFALLLLFGISVVFGWAQALTEALVLFLIIAIPFVILYVIVYVMIDTAALVLISICRIIKAFFLWLCAKEQA